MSGSKVRQALVTDNPAPTDTMACRVILPAAPVIYLHKHKPLVLEGDAAAKVRSSRASNAPAGSASGSSARQARANVVTTSVPSLVSSDMRWDHVCALQK